MSLKSIVRELREMRDGIGSMSRRAADGRGGGGRGGSRHSWPGLWSEQQQPPQQQQLQRQEHQQQQGRWANLPPELLLDVIQRVEASEATWPARRQVVACAAVCRSWREVTKEVVKTLEECGRITFPISLKQPGPREHPVQCFVRRDRATSTYLLYLGLSPSLHGENDKLLLAARKIRRATRTSFVISLVSNDFSLSSSTYVGKLKPNFLGTKFTIFDSQPPCDAVVLPNNRPSKRHFKQVSPRLPLGNYNVATVSYELTVLRNRGPRRMQCTMHSIPALCIQEGGKAPTPTGIIHSLDEQVPALSTSKGKEPAIEFSSTSLSADLSGPVCTNEVPLVLKNKAPRWHEQLQCWCLNFRGRVTVASVKNFQLVASVDPSLGIPAAEQEKVILQFGKIGKDIFTMDYRYPLSAFQAFAICLTSFDTKPACE
ncbi:tubby-like F-box protein 5 [Oryza glaberrima]|uniref:Tubby-like F-box protein n=1 Tax=Oryza glaberrima TaxID=4538 RepID=I1P3H1_ORYGL|nr:tubby-like F-box protein 5 [Oryza glaberrima]